MTFDEALARLGLSRQSSQQEAKRAYLKLLKQTRPEENRDAFIALRDAYELVRAGIEWRDQARAAGIVAPIPESDGEAHSGSTESERLRAALVSAPRESGEAKAERMVRVEFDARIQASAGEAAAARTPVEEARRMCQQFDEHGHEPGVVPPVAMTLRIIFWCLAAGEIEPARALADKLSTWLTRSGQEASLGPLIPFWLSARELVAVAPAIPPRFFVPIAEAALAGDVAKAAKTLAPLQKDTPEVARSVLTELKLHAPWLATTVGWCLVPPQPRKRMTLKVPAWVASLGIFLIFRLLTLANRSTPERTLPAQFVAPQTWTPPDLVKKGTVGYARPTEPLKQALNLFFQLNASVGDTMTRCHLQPAQALVAEIGDQVRSGQCSHAESTMQQLQLSKDAYSVQEWRCAEVDIGALHRALTLVCAEARKVFDAGDSQ